LGFARHALQEVHDLNPRINPQPFVPLPDNPDVEESYAHLLELEREEGSSHLYRPVGAKRKYTVSELLDGVRGPDVLMPPPAPRTASPLPTNPSPKKPDRTWLYLSLLWAFVGASAFWYLNIFGSEELASRGRVFGSVAFGGAVFYFSIFHDPKYAYLRLLRAR
jgi:hypothetical protein